MPTLRTRRVDLLRGPLTAAAATGGAVLLASCGLVGEPSGSDDVTRAAKVAVLVPEGTASGEGVRAAVAAAIDETITGIEGWTVEVETVDDSTDDGTGLAAVAEEITDDDVVAVVGGLSTETVRAVQPVFDESSLLFISPADALPEHTRGADAGNPVRPYETYFRSAVSGDDPMYALARHANSTLEVDTVAVIDAGDGGSDDQAGVFAEAVRATGGEVVRVDEPDHAESGDGQGSGDDSDSDDGTENGPTPEGSETPTSGDGGGPDDGPGNEATPGSDDTEDAGAMTVDDMASMLGRARNREADAVFVSGSSEVAAEVANQLAAGGKDLDLLGGQVVTRENFLAEAGSSAEGAWTALPGQLEPTEGAFPDGLREHMSDAETTPGQYGAAAYDAGAAIGIVLERCLPPATSASSAREGCVGEMAALNFQGVTGEVEFDRYGDRVGARPVVQTVQDGEWTAVEPAER